MAEKTLKESTEEELQFIPAVVRKSLVVLNSTWDMTVSGALMLSIAAKGNVGQALYMLSVIDPKPNHVVTDTEVAFAFPMGFTGDWSKTWEQFSQTDQRAVFKK